jgi:hypothetical protein
VSGDRDKDTHETERHIIHSLDTTRRNRDRDNITEKDERDKRL